MALGQLFRPKIAPAKPASLSDFDFPTAEETRAIPKVYGTCKLMAPNVVSVTDFSTSVLTRKVPNPITFGLTKKNQPVGFKYYCGIEMALAYRFDELQQIIIGDKLAWSGSVTTDSEIFINKPTLFGGDDATSEGNGGVAGYLGVHLGSASASKDSYLVSEYGNYSAHRGVGYVVWKGQHRAKGSGYLGNSSSVAPWAFVCKGIPTNIPGAGAYANINTGDANPAEVIYDVMRNSEYAVGMNGAFIDDASFLACAQTFFNDGIGFSALWDTTKPCREIINALLLLTDSVLYSSLETGKMILKAARADYVTADLQLFDETNILELVSYARGAWAETTNEVKVAYTDRFNGFIPRNAISQDLANQRIQGGTISTNVQHIGISNGLTGAKISMRDLKALTTPLSKIVIRVNRTAYKMVPGGVFKFSWAKIVDERGNPISNMVMRVTGIKYGQGKVPVIEIEAIEDVFNATSNVLAATPASGAVAVTVPPAASSTQRIDETPFFLQGGADEATLWAQAVAPNSGNNSFDLYDGTASTDADLDPDDLNNPTTPSGVLAGSYAQNTSAIDAGGTFIVTGSSSTGLDALTLGTPADIARGENLMLVVQGSVVEIMAFESFSVNGAGNYVFTNVWRGLLDTVPQAFTAGARVYFFSYGDARGTTAFVGGTTAYAKLIPRSGQGTLDLASATLLSRVITRRAVRPYPPGYFRINGSFTTTIVPTSGDVALAWAFRDRTRQASVIAQNDTSITGFEGGAVATLKIYKGDGTLLRTVNNIITGTYTYLNTDEMADNGGVLADALTFVLYTTRDGVGSMQAWVRTVTRNAPATVVPTYAPGGTYAQPPAGNATSISGVTVTGTPTSTNNTPVFDPATNTITWAPGGGSGVQWLTGAGAPSSGTGSNGDMYLNTTNADVYKKVSGAWVFQTNIKGATGVTGATGATGAAGAAGTPGSVWYVTSGAPGSGVGVNGDMALDSTTGDVYKKVTGAWTLTGNIKGATGASGAALPRSTVVLTTASLTNNAVEAGTVALAKSFMLMRVQVSAACRVELYATTAHRDADASRPASTPPTLGSQHGVITDLVLDTADKFDWHMSPEATGSNLEAVPTSSIAYRVTNLSGGTATITVTFTIVNKET